MFSKVGQSEELLQRLSEAEPFAAAALLGALPKTH